MTKARIQFSPEILKRLGEELNPSPYLGILELVKNSYDADASKCVISMKNTDDLGGSIIIEDDGDGMGSQDIKNGWLVLGRSGKETLQPTRKGRIPVGNKGLGRLAALRLGKRAGLKTSHRNSPNKTLDLTIDWSAFDQADVVEDVDLNIKTINKKRRLGHGTSITLSGLYEPIGRMEVKRLARALLLLADPFSNDKGGFSPSLVTPEFEDLEKLVKSGYFSEAEYHLSANVDSGGSARATVADWKGNVLYQAQHKDIRTKKGNPKYNCEDVTFDLWVFILKAASFTERAVSLGEVREWLEAFGGVHLYEDGLRVSPYGNPGNDWLDMNLSRARSPEERPSTNTSIGRVLISSNNAILKQKTDRSGYIETEAFVGLKEFAKDSLDWMFRERLATAEKRRIKKRAQAPRKVSKQKKAVAKAIAKVPQKQRAKVESAFQAYEKTRDREVAQLVSEVQLYRTLSTAGITAATFAHEAEGNPLKVILTGVESLKRRLNRYASDHYDKRFRDIVDGISHSASSLKVLGNTTLRLVKRDKRRIGRVEIHNVIKNVIEMFEPFFKGRNAEVSASFCDGKPYLRASEAAIESIVTNLLNNSLNAFETSKTKRRMVYVRTHLLGDSVRLCVLDNGSGIKGIGLKSIWLPGQTTRDNGTGLGLTIVRDTVRDLGGTVKAVENGELGGAEFHIELPILGA